MKNFLLAAGAVIAILYVGKKLSSPAPQLVAPRVPEPLPPAPAVTVKDGDKVVLSDGTFSVLSVDGDTLLIALRTPWTLPENQKLILKSSVISVIPRKQA